MSDEENNSDEEKGMPGPDAPESAWWRTAKESKDENAGKVKQAGLIASGFFGKLLCAIRAHDWKRHQTSKRLQVCQRCGKGRKHDAH